MGKIRKRKNFGLHGGVMMQESNRRSKKELARVGIVKETYSQRTQKKLREARLA